MTANWAIVKFNGITDMKWHPMLLLSMVFHLIIFSVIFFVPESMSIRATKGIVYQVDLVEMPAGKASASSRSRPMETGKGVTNVNMDTGARRIKNQKKEVKPFVIAKRTVKRKRSTIKKSKVSPSRLIDRTIAKIEKKVKSQENQNHIDNAISKLESKVQSQESSGTRGGQAISGVSIRMYQMEVETRIKDNWSYPVALQDSKNLGAIVILKVKNNGTILTFRFIKRSLNSVFDQSVLKAIEKSDPLPAFPEGYRKTYDDIEINFNLKDLEGY